MINLFYLILDNQSRILALSKTKRDNSLNIALPSDLLQRYGIVVGDSDYQVLPVGLTHFKYDFNSRSIIKVQNLDFAKIEKLKYLDSMCKNKINSTINFEGIDYKCDLESQMNISMAISSAKISGNCIVVGYRNGKKEIITLDYEKVQKLFSEIGSYILSARLQLNRKKLELETAKSIEAIKDIIWE